MLLLQEDLGKLLSELHISSVVFFFFSFLILHCGFYRFNTMLQSSSMVYLERLIYTTVTSGISNLILYFHMLHHHDFGTSIFKKCWRSYSLILICMKIMLLCCYLLHFMRSCCSQPSTSFKVGSGPVSWLELMLHSWEA